MWMFVLYTVSRGHYNLQNPWCRCPQLFLTQLVAIKARGYLSAVSWIMERCEGRAELRTLTQHRSCVCVCVCGAGWSCRSMFAKKRMTCALRRRARVTNSRLMRRNVRPDVSLLIVQYLSWQCGRVGERRISSNRKSNLYNANARFFPSSPGCTPTMCTTYWAYPASYAAKVLRNRG